MPVTRRRRANPPEQPENNNNHLGEQPENTVGAVPTEQQAEPAVAEEHQSPSAPTASPTAAPTEDSSYQQLFAVPLVPPATTNGDQGGGRQEYSQTIEGGRRTARGELFRRPPQAPVGPPVQPASVATPVALQPPSHEIKLPLGEGSGDASGDPLHLAYNPGYTGSEEVRSILLHKLAVETKHGGRARCWGCGSLAVAYECWNTRNKTFGEIGIAYCEICGVWSVM